MSEVIISPLVPMDSDMGNLQLGSIEMFAQMSWKVEQASLLEAVWVCNRFGGLHKSWVYLETVWIWWWPLCVKLESKTAFIAYNCI